MNEDPQPDAMLTDPDDDYVAGMRRRGRRRRIILFLAGLVVFVVFVARPRMAPAGWDGDFDAAMKRATETDRLVVVAFHGAYCPPCHTMDRTVLGKPAVRKALVTFYPRLEVVKLVDYKVRIIDPGAGTGALVRVLIELTDGDQFWRTVGASTDIIEASWLALNDGLEYWLLKWGGEASQ